MFTGGSGAIRLIPYLESLLPPVLPSPKVLVGFSDITVLHLYLQAKYNLPSIQGKMLESIANNATDLDQGSVTTLENLLFNRTSVFCEPLMTRLDNREPISVIEDTVVTGKTLKSSKWII